MRLATYLIPSVPGKSAVFLFLFAAQFKGYIYAEIDASSEIARKIFASKMLHMGYAISLVSLTFSSTE